MKVKSMTEFNLRVAQAGFAFGLCGGLLNAVFGDLAWTLLCFASMSVSLLNLHLLKSAKESSTHGESK
jgi:hypothetical protein